MTPPFRPDIPPLAPVPPAKVEPEYLTLEELEKIAFAFADQGAGIVAAAPDVWLLQVHDNGVQRTYRAHRPQGGAA